SGDRAIDRLRVSKIPNRLFYLEALKRRPIGSGSNQHSDPVPPREQRAHHVAPDKPVSARYKRQPPRHRSAPGRHDLAATAAAAARPEMTALSMVAGRPVWIQSPARNRFFSGVATPGRSRCASVVGAIVACFSLSTIALLTLALRAAGIIVLRSFNTRSSRSSFGRSTSRRAPLMTKLR